MSEGNQIQSRYGLSWRRRMVCPAALLFCGIILAGLAFAQVPAVSLSTTALFFGDQRTGQTSSPVSCTLTNTGDAPLSISGTSIAGLNARSFAIQTGGEPGVLTPGASRAIFVTFTPTDEGPHSAVLLIASDAPDSPHQGSLSGNGVARGLRLKPEPVSIDFGAQTVGTTSSVRSVLFTNAGTAPGQILDVSFSGSHAGAFTVVSGSDPGIIPPGAGRSIGLTFSPSAAGFHHAEVLVRATDLESGFTWVYGATLTGRGTLPAGPAISFSPNSLTFGPQPIRTTSSPQTITITNTGSTAGFIDHVGVSSHPAEWAFVAGGETGALEPGASRTISLTFTPYFVGTYTTSLVISVTDPSNSTSRLYTASLTGTGLAVPTPRIDLYPVGLSFQPQQLGTTWEPQSAILTNRGDAPLSISAVTVTGSQAASFSLLGGREPGTLAPGASRAIIVAFSPATAGTHLAAVKIASDAWDGPDTVSLVGWAVTPTPQMSLNPSQLTFGPQGVGTTSPSQNAVLTNTGDALLLIDRISLAGTHPESFVITAGSGSASLPPGASRTISVAFAPNMPGPRNAVVAVYGNVSGSPHHVILIGEGTDPPSQPPPSPPPPPPPSPPPPTGAPAASVHPASLTFGEQRVGTSSGAQSVTVTSAGTAPLVIQGIALTGAHPGDFRVVAGGPGTLTPGSSQTLSLVFAPTATGPRAAALEIRTNASGSPHTVSLIGIGTRPPDEPPAPPVQPPPAPSVQPPPAPVPADAPIAAIHPDRLHFSDQSVGGPGETLSLTVRNTGSALLVIHGVTVSMSHRAEFQVVGNPTGGLPAGSSRIISLRFTPTAVGARAGTLEIRTNAAGSPHRVPLTGSGVVANPAAPVSDWPVFGHDPRQLGLADGALDPRSLAAWSVVLGYPPGSSPVVKDGVVYVGTEGGVFAIDIATRSLRWQRELPAPVRSAPAVHGSVVVVSAQGLYGLSVADGRLLWQRPDLLAPPDVSPMVAGDTVYLGGRTGGGERSGMWAVRAATGANVWPGPSPLPAGSESRATAAVYPELGLLFAGLGPPPTSPPTSGPSAVIALRVRDGAAAWAAPAVLPAGPPPSGVALGWIGSPAGELQPALFLTTGPHVTALNVVTGARIWSRMLPETLQPFPPVVTSSGLPSGRLFVGSASGRVYALHADNGADARGGLVTPHAPITGPLALAGPYLYIPTALGLVAADAATGARLWVSTLVAAGGVAVAGGSPYVATAHTRLVGFSPPSPAVIRDLAIESLHVPARVSRRVGAEVRVTLVNRGTQPESYSLLVRVQPGLVVLLDRRGVLAPGETKAETFLWPPELMGDDGPKSLVAQLTLSGQEDATPADNHALQPVTIIP